MHGRRAITLQSMRRLKTKRWRQRPKIESLARHLNAGEALTLLCSSACEDPARCHRFLLKGLVEDATKAQQEARDQCSTVGT